MEHFAMRYGLLKSYPGHKTITFHSSSETVKHKNYNENISRKFYIQTCKSKWLRGQGDKMGKLKQNLYTDTHMLGKRKWRGPETKLTCLPCFALYIDRWFPSLWGQWPFQNWPVSLPNGQKEIKQKNIML